MTSAPTHAEVLRAVAIDAVKDAQTAKAKADKSPTEEHVRAAYYACVFASRALLRASEVNPDEEDAMIDRSFVINEDAFTLKTKLVTLIEPDLTTA